MHSLIFTHGGNIYEAARQTRKKVLDFSASINPLGLPERIKKVMRDNFDSILHYPDPEAKDLIKAIARHWNIGEENILPGNGSMELIHLIVWALKPKTALIPAPDFSGYECALTAAKSRVSFLKLAEDDGFRLDLSLVKPSDIFFFSNPHNPSGSIMVKGADKIENLPNKTVVVDEAFMDFVNDENEYTMIRRAVKDKKIIVLRTFTKFFSMPGLRAGYLVAHKDVIRLLKAHQAPWSVNVLAQITAESMLGDKAYIDSTRFFIGRERRFLSDSLGDIEGLRPLPSAANFILLKIEKKGITSGYVAEEMLNRGILVRDCGNFRNLRSQYIRVAVKKREENMRLISAFKDIWKR